MAGPTSAIVADGAEDHAAVVVEQLRRRHQVGGAAHQVRARRVRRSRSSVGEAERGHQRRIDVAALVVEGARRGDRASSPLEQVRRRVGVHVGQCRHLPDVVAQPRHLRIQVGEDRVRVDRATRRTGRPARSAPSAVALRVWFSLIGSTCSAIAVTVSNNGVELRGHRRRASITVIARNALCDRIFRGAEGHVLVAEHGGGADLGHRRWTGLAADSRGSTSRVSHGRAATVALPARRR